MAGKKTLDQKTIDQICKHLTHILADTFVIYVKTLNFHWNMVSPEFFMYHKLLENQYKELAEATDELAERMRMLGRLAPGTMSDFHKHTCLKEAKNTLKWKPMVQELVSDHETMVEHLHAAITYCDEVLDQGTSDLLVDRMRSHDKAAYLLRSHLEK